MRVSSVTGMWAIRYLQSLERTSHHQSQALAQGTIPLTQNVSATIIAERMRSQITGYREAMQSTYNAIGMMNVAEGGLRSIGSILQRMRELAVQAGNSSLTDAERATLQQEFNQLRQGIDRTVQQTTYNNRQVLGGEIRNFQVQIGPNEGQTLRVSIPRMNTEALGLRDVNLNSVESSRQALEALDRAIETVSNTRSYIGSTTNRLGSAARELSTTMVNLTASASALTDTDMARSMMDFVRTRLMAQATAGVLAQSNVRSMDVLRLLG